MSFAARLEVAQRMWGPVCVGADPHPGLLASWDLTDTAAGLARFAETVAEAFAGRVSAVKPQVALFERHGSAGLAALESLIARFREAGTLVISDAKRGDIGSTMAGYADAWLGEGPLGSDAVTLSPYLGVGALRPAFEKAAEADRGVFVLAVTSNPEGRTIQGAGEPPLAQRVLDELGAANRELWPGQVGSIGAVVGATAGEAMAQRGIDVDVLSGVVLAPGAGAQGASLAQARAVCGANLSCIPMSRSILSAGPSVTDLRERLDEASRG